MNWPSLCSMSSLRKGHGAAQMSGVPNKHPPPPLPLRLYPRLASTPHSGEMILSTGTPATRATTFSPLSALTPSLTAIRLHMHKHHLFLFSQPHSTISCILSLSLFLSLFHPRPRHPFSAFSAEGLLRSPFQPPRPDWWLIGRRWRRPFTGVLEHSAGPSQASGYGL